MDDISAQTAIKSLHMAKTYYLPNFPDKFLSATIYIGSSLVRGSYFQTKSETKLILETFLQLLKARKAIDSQNYDPQPKLSDYDNTWDEVQNRLLYEMRTPEVKNQFTTQQWEKLTSRLKREDIYL